MTIQSYLDTLNLRYKTGISREHTYRGDLQTLLMTILPDILVTNEPARVAFGVPDHMLTRKDAIDDFYFNMLIYQENLKFKCHPSILSS
jgi:hypothetical protein